DRFGTAGVDREMQPRDRLRLFFLLFSIRPFFRPVSFASERKLPAAKTAQQISSGEIAWLLFDIDSAGGGNPSINPATPQFEVTTTTQGGAVGSPDPDAIGRLKTFPVATDVYSAKFLCG